MSLPDLPSARDDAVNKIRNEHKKIDLILSPAVGAIIIGTRASELIGEATIAIESQLKIEKFLEVIHAHPTLSEAFTEAVRDINGKSIHLPSRTKS